METIDDRTFKEKVYDWKVRQQFKWAGRCNNAKRFIVENKEFCIGMAFITVPGVLKMGNSLIRHHQAAMELKRRDTDIWDPKRGQHYYIKRRMTANQQIEYNRRYDANEDGATILKSMRLL